MSKTYCAKLWDHQYINMSGSVRFCCVSLQDLNDSRGASFNTKHDSLKDVWNSQIMRQTRLDMMQGKSIKACTKCYDQESRGYVSMRDPGNMASNFAKTGTDGSMDHMPSELELHFGNLCNLKCKMCGQQYSNQVGKELLDIGKKDKQFLDWVYKESGNVNIYTNNLSVEYDWFKDEQAKVILFKFIADNIRTLTVIGGEPTVIPEFWELFEYLDQNDKLKNINITITTNLTNVNPKMTRWLPKVKRWRIWASVDGTGDRTEYIRFPSNFSRVVENINFYKSLLPQGNGEIILSPAIQLLNIDQLDEILDWWLEISGDNFGHSFGVSWHSQVWYPVICNYDIAPKDYKMQVANKLRKSSHKYKNYKSIHKYYENQIDNLSKDMCRVGDRIHFQKAFIRYNDTQDRHRKGKTWRQLLPALESSLNESLSTF